MTPYTRVLNSTTLKGAPNEVPPGTFSASSSSTQLWTQPGGAGTPIETTDPLAGVQSGVANSASGEVSVCLGGSSNTASGGGTVCVGGFGNTITGASAGCYSSYLCSSTGTTSVCMASNGAVASALGSACIASAGGVASGDWSACIGGTNGIAAGQNAVSIGGGNAPNDNDIAIGGAAALVGFFGAACVAQQADGGSGTAGPVYTANEQQMLQAVYTALKNLGLIA
jgi:hypothetical protein